MDNIEQINTIKSKLDLREGWKQVEQKDVEGIINKEDKGNYWWYNEDKTRIITLKNGKFANYKISETEILFAENSIEVSHIEQETQSEVLMDLFLSPENKVKDTADAYKKAKYSDKKKFWFISKGNWNKAVIVLDFSVGKKPRRTVYPLSKYKVQMNTVKI